MKNPNKLWKDITYRFAEQSQCKSRKVGCIIVKDDFLLGEGWNSAPYGSTTEMCPRDKCNGKSCEAGKDLSQAVCAHAEANAIGNCASTGRSTKNATLYSSTKPCSECAKLIVAAKIRKVVFFEDYPSPLTERILENAGIDLVSKVHI